MIAGGRISRSSFGGNTSLGLEQLLEGSSSGERYFGAKA
jgi:hypothetical protein